MSESNYDVLMKKISVKDETEQRIIVDKRIEEILSKSLNAQYTLEALICAFEGQSSVNTGLAVMAITYGVLCTGIELLPKTVVSDGFMSFVLIVAACILVFLSIKTTRKDRRRLFILSALKFRYDKMQANISKENEKDEREYIVKVKVK